MTIAGKFGMTIAGKFGMTIAGKFSMTIAGKFSMTIAGKFSMTIVGRFCMTGLRKRQILVLAKKLSPGCSARESGSPEGYGGGSRKHGRRGNGASGSGKRWLRLLLWSIRRRGLCRCRH